MIWIRPETFLSYFYSKTIIGLMATLEQHCHANKHLPIPILLYDKSGYVVCQNSAATNLLGPLPVDFKQKGDGLVTSGLANDRIAVLVERQLAHKAPLSPECMMLMPADGVGKNMIVQLCPLIDDDDEIIGAMCMLINALPGQSVRHPEETAGQLTSVFQEDPGYKSNGNLYWKMIEEIEDYAILLLDTQGYIQNWNKGAEKIKGYTSREIVGQNFRIFYLPDDQQSNLPEQLIQEARVRGKAIHEGWRVRKDRTVFWGSIVLTALHGADNKVIGFTKVTRDLTERKNAENKIRDYNAELEAQNNELKQFNYVASHDLQEPLRKIRTFGGILTSKFQDALDSEGRDLIIRMQSATDRMKKLIDDLLNFSKVSKKEGGPDFSLINTAVLLEDLITEYDGTLVEVAGKIEVGRLYPVWGVEWQVRQVFQNLIGNSIKYARAGVPLSIQISSRLIDTSKELLPFTEMGNKGKYQMVEFRDNGIGFEQQYADRIFQVFQRLHGKKEYEGTGIGLSIVHKVVENHRGYIKANGEPGKGALFTLFLPFGEAHYS